ncbi:SDR family NAD(P)-dependent oxidoreductase [Kineosporia babensis]|uniref:SDR family NAD(P)-dependent oxidoreductase n=1 Tax=Kineosporia babensis TaxID=499548 RepID=A0A9X1NML7_9ACTN|nr:SDR family NAD(P)-dependent oxidoreductase [Kineosporia babensis]MCD5316309.1 SDR family NAD(P)-dependent oxidoreductase [Kineosporia babensis]
MPNRVVLITGATDGLGRALAEALAPQPDITLILHGRDPARLEKLEAAHKVQADFADLAQVHRMAEEVTGLTDHLSVLVNNAGIGSGAPDGDDRRLSKDGYELRFAVNYLAAFALTQRLLPRLDTGAPARIVHVSSLGQAPIDFADPQIEHDYSGLRAYGQSKLAMVTYGQKLAQELDPARITVNSLHPATYMPTKMVLARRPAVDTLETGLEATLRLINSPDLDGVTGQFFDRTRPARAHDSAYDPEVQQRLWDLSLSLTSERQ